MDPKSALIGSTKRTSAFFRCVPFDGFLFCWTLTVGQFVSRNKKPTCWDSEPHIQATGQTDIFYPIRCAPLCQRKGRRSSLNRIPPVSPQFSVFWSGEFLFTITDVLLDTLHRLLYILNEVAGLAVQKSAKGFKVLPGYTLLLAELL